MSALLNDGRLRPPRAQLGTLLLKRGLLTEAQLELALAEQGSSGRQLGEILIGLGFVSATTIAQALATQQGRVLKTEYGFATGFDSTMSAGSATRPAPVQPTPIVPAPAPAPPAPPELPPAAEVADLRRRLEEAVAVVGTLTHERDEPASSPAEQPERSLSVDAETFTNRIVELEDALAVELARRIELEALVREQPWASSERHLVFFRGPAGYAFSERLGPPPLPGARIEVAGSGATQVVTRVAPAPLPGHALPCAYLATA